MLNEKKKRKRSWLKIIFYGVFWTGFVLSLIGAGGSVAGYYYLAMDLPPLYSLRSYHPKIITEVYSDDGTLITEFAEERRRIVPISEIPKHVQMTFVAAEDHRFLEHKGVDWYSVVRAFVTNIRHGRIETGASSISMQVARTFFLTMEKTYKRKLKEAILAVRIEKYLTKEEILFLYLSQINLGMSCYGVGEASHYYFGKSVKDISQPEAAMLAGILPAPSNYNPVKDFSVAKRQQKYVLWRMAHPEVGFITQEEAQEAYEAPIQVIGRVGPRGEAAPHFTMQVRRILNKRYGRETVYNQGLKVFTTVNLKADKAAAKAVREKVLSPKGLDKGLGYRGALAHLSGSSVRETLDKQEEALAKKWARNMWREALAKGAADKVKKDDLTAMAPDPVGLTLEEIYKGVVADVDDSKKEVRVIVGHSQGMIKKKDMSWAGKFKKDIRPPARLKKPSEILAPGDLILVKVLGQEQDDRGKIFYRFGLEQESIVEAGLFSMSTRRGHVKALCGGVKGDGAFIRPIQSIRQPGSAMKPIVYAAALDDPLKRFTTATIIIDSAMVFEKGDRAGGMEIYQRYKPKNYDGSFSGPRTFRQALAKSVNTIAVRIGIKLGMSFVVEYARKLGIKSDLDMLPCLPLGCSELTLSELCTAYNVFATGGHLIEPVYISRVYDRDGNLLYYEERMGPVAAKASDGDTQAGSIAPPGDADTVSGNSAGEAPAPLADADTVPGDSTEGIEEQDIFSEKPSPVARAPRLYYLSKPLPPQQLGEPTWEEYLEEIRSEDHEWLDLVTFPARGSSVMTPQTAYLMNSMLQSVVGWGTGTRARKLGRPLAGKTGTTNKSRDALFVGYSPELLAGVWVGCDNYSYSLGKGMSGSKAALPIWVDYMGNVLSDRPKVDFPVPKGIKWVKVDTTTGLLYNDECGKNENKRTEVFKKGTEPTEFTKCNMGTPGRTDLDRALDP